MSDNSQQVEQQVEAFRGIFAAVALYHLIDKFGNLDYVVGTSSQVADALVNQLWGEEDEEQQPKKAGF